MGLSTFTRYFFCGVSTIGTEIWDDSRDVIWFHGLNNDSMWFHGIYNRLFQVNMRRMCLKTWHTHAYIIPANGNFEREKKHDDKSLDFWSTLFSDTSKYVTFNCFLTTKKDNDFSGIETAETLSIAAWLRTWKIPIWVNYWWRIYTLLS